MNIFSIISYFLKMIFYSVDRCQTKYIYIFFKKFLSLFYYFFASYSFNRLCDQGYKCITCLLSLHGSKKYNSYSPALHFLLKLLRFLCDSNFIRLDINLHSSFTDNTSFHLYLYVLVCILADYLKNELL